MIQAIVVSRKEYEKLKEKVLKLEHKIKEIKALEAEPLNAEEQEFILQV